jgi:hypothetical protein
MKQILYCCNKETCDCHLPIETESLTNELTEHEALLEQYKDDIRQLEEKLKNAREKERIIIDLRPKYRFKLIKRGQKLDKLLGNLIDVEV